jgi:palmitoyltransferase
MALSFHQAFSWFLCLFATAGFFSTVFILSSNPCAYVIVALYSLSLIGIAVSGTVVTLTNHSTLETTEKSHVFCTACKVTVPSSCKHCRLCNCCVFGFDHHCKWVNNCIGSKNYFPFIVFLCFINAASAVILASGARLFLTEDLSERTQAVYGTNQVGGLLGVIAVTMAVAGAVMLHSSILLSLHIFLKVKGVSTYEFIVLRRMSSVSSVRTWELTGVEVRELSVETLPLPNQWLPYSERNPSKQETQVLGELYRTAR